MITKIVKLKQFGVFDDFSWDSKLSEFKKYNLIYGWNRSGKTTISRVFGSCEKKCTYDEDGYWQYPENGEFQIKTSIGKTIKSSNITSNSLSVKVFNQDFIDENISFDPSDSCNAIVYVSEEDIESKKQLELLEKERVKLVQNHESSKQNRISKEETKNTFLTGLGREVANILFDKSYNKINAERKIKQIGIRNFPTKILSKEDKEKYETISRSVPEKIQNTIPNLTSTSDEIESLFTQIKSSINKSVVSELLERLKDSDDMDGGLDEKLNDWVKQGFDLHKDKNSFNKCLFCENKVDNNLFNSLSRHFSKDYEDLQNSIQLHISSLQNIKVQVINANDFELYPDLKKQFKKKIKEYNKVAKQQNNWIFSSEALLENVKPPFSCTQILNT